MALNIPSLDELVAPFRGLKTGALRKEADAAGIPFTTFWKLVKGDTTDPRIETVRLLAAYVERKGAAAVEPPKQPKPKRQRAAASSKSCVYERGDGTVVRDERHPESAKEWIPPRRRSEDRPR
jgi:hypothetical protein